MRNLLIAFAMLFGMSAATSQSTIWKKTVTEKGFMKQLDSGSILFKDNNEISLLNHETGEVLWTSEVTTGDDPKFFRDIPLMYFEGKNYAVMDASTGDIIDQSATKTEVLDIHYYWDKARVVLELSRDKNLHILNIDLNDTSKSWNTKAGKVQKMLFGLAARSSENAPAIDDKGTMAIVDKKYILFISKDGVAADKLEFNKDLKKIGFNRAKGILYVMEDKKILHYVELATSKIITSIDLKEDDLKFALVNDDNTVAIIQKKECIMLDAANGASLGNFESADKIKKVYVDPETGRYYLLLKKNITELSVTDASVVQSKDTKPEYQEIYAVKDYVYVSGRGKINQVDLSNLSFLYPEAASAPPVHNYIDLKDSRLYTYQIGPKFEMVSVDNSGKKLWSKSYTSPRTVTVEKIDGDLLVISGTDVQYLNHETGKNIWNKKIKVDPSFTYVPDLENNRYYFYSDKRVYTFKIEDKALVLSTDKFKFKDFDYQTQQPVMILTDAGIFLKGSNSIFVSNYGGTIESEQHYKKSSNTSGLLKLANTAVAVAAIGSGNADKVLTVYSNGEQVHKGSLVDDMNSSWSYANDAAAQRQAKQNSTSAEYPYVFTKLENGKKGLIFLEAETGKERLDVVMDEKSPNYILDEIDGVLFYLDKKLLKAIDIK